MCNKGCYLLRSRQLTSHGQKYFSYDVLCTCYHSSCLLVYWLSDLQTSLLVLLLFYHPFWHQSSYYHWFVVVHVPCTCYYLIYVAWFRVSIPYRYHIYIKFKSHIELVIHLIYTTQKSALNYTIRFFFYTGVLGCTDRDICKSVMAY